MDILKTATDWTKAEVLSSTVFILFGLAFAMVSFGFWHMGRTEVAKAYVIPMLVAGVLLLIIGVGLFVPSHMRISGFPNAYKADATAFVTSELARSDKVLNEYRLVVIRVIPLIVAVCALLIIMLEAPVWRASLITTIAMMSIILLVDINAIARLENYKEQLSLAEKQK